MIFTLLHIFSWRKSISQAIVAAA